MQECSNAAMQQCSNAEEKQNARRQMSQAGQMEEVAGWILIG
jgi:hypothetical protein